LLCGYATPEAAKISPSRAVLILRQTGYNSIFVEAFID
jgi:hypothetical protein